MDSAARCPLCGGPNECGVAAGTSTCWCWSAEIPAETLAGVPEAQRGRICVCEKCARAEHGEESNELPAIRPGPIAG
jgi:hypothetical protein